MNEIALTLPKSTATTASDAVSQPLATDRTIIALGIVLAVMQVADGIMTAVGVMKFGAAIEGNVLLRSLMMRFDPILVLLVVKSIALVVVYGLCRIGNAVTWMKPALSVVAGLYLFAAIIPWSLILF